MIIVHPNERVKSIQVFFSMQCNKYIFLYKHSILFLSCELVILHAQSTFRLVIMWDIVYMVMIEKTFALNVYICLLLLCSCLSQRAA
jgi:hypothetical protein